MFAIRRTPLSKTIRAYLLPSLLPACFFSLVTALAAMMHVEPELTTINKGHVLIIAVISLPFFLPAVSGFFALLDRWHARCASLASGNRRAIPAWGFFLLLFGLWLPWLVAMYPGNVAFDTGTSIMNFLGLVDYNVNNPVLQTAIFGAVYQLGDRFLPRTNDAFYAYCFIQATLHAAVIASFLGFFSQRGVHWPVLVFAVFFLSVLPIFPIYASLMGKDGNFTLVLLFILRLLLDLMTSEKPATWPQKLLLGGSVTLICFLRNGTVFIMLPTLLLLGLFFRSRRRLAMVTAATMTAVSFIVPVALQLPKAEFQENLSIPIQQIAYTVNHNPVVSDEERAEVYRFHTEEYLATYDPNSADTLKDGLRETITSPEAIGEYLMVWLRLGLTHPLSYLKAHFLSTCAYYVPGVTTDAKPHHIVGYDIKRSIYDVTSLEIDIPLTLFRIKELCVSIENHPFLRYFVSIGLYSWLLILLAVYAVSRRRRSLLVLVLPYLLILVACCFTPINGYMRYAMTFIFPAPFLLLAAVAGPEKRSDISRPEEVPSGPDIPSSGSATEEQLPA